MDEAQMKTFRIKSKSMTRTFNDYMLYKAELEAYDLN